MRPRTAALAFLLALSFAATAYSQDQNAPADSKPQDQNAASDANASAARPKRLRVGNNVMDKKKIHNVLPEYPMSAKMRGIQGTVLLHMVLDVDGKVEELQFISGPKELIKPAMDAVRQWRYSPTTLNGQPVEIETKVAIIYGLN